MNNIVESLRALFEKLGGSASAEKKDTIAAAIDQITTVASSGGGGGSTETVEGTIGSTAKDGELYFGSFVNEKAAIITTESELTINGYPLTPVTEEVNKPTFYYNLDLESFTPTGAPAFYVEVDTNSVTIGSSEDLAGENVVLAVKVSGGSADEYIVNFTVDESGDTPVVTADKSIADISAAFAENKSVVGYYPYNGAILRIPCVAAPTGFAMFGVWASTQMLAISGVKDGSADEWSVTDVGFPVPSNDNNGEYLGVARGKYVLIADPEPLIVHLTPTQDDNVYTADVGAYVVGAALHDGRPAYALVVPTGSSGGFLMPYINGDASRADGGFVFNGFAYTITHENTTVTLDSKEIGDANRTPYEYDVEVSSISGDHGTATMTPGDFADAKSALEADKLVFLRVSGINPGLTQYVPCSYDSTNGIYAFAITNYSNTPHSIAIALASNVGGIDIVPLSTTT